MSRHNDCRCTPMMTQSERNVGWLIFLVRARRRQHSGGARLERLPRLRLIAGGRDLLDEALRQRVRERLADGSLFRAHGVSIVRPGTGRPCNVCGRAIAKDGTEREVDDWTDNTTYFAPEECYQL